MKRRRPSPDQIEMDFAQTGPDGGPVISSDCRPIDAPRPSATIYQFPQRIRLSATAAALWQDMRGLAAGAQMVDHAFAFFNHSIADGVRCSGAAKHKVVKARRELQDAGLVVMVAPGNELGPTVWRVSRTQLLQPNPRKTSA